MGLRGLQDNLTVPLFESKDKVVAEYALGRTDSPAGPFSVGVAYRTACDFRVDDSEALLSSRFLGTDDEIFAPSLSTKDLVDRPRTKPIHDVGSLPSQTRHHIPHPDLDISDWLVNADVSDFCCPLAVSWRCTCPQKIAPPFVPPRLPAASHGYLLPPTAASLRPSLITVQSLGDFQKKTQ
jgi:hypothetical protein